MDKAQLAKDILKHVGGEENVNSLVHCTTRLRFKLRKKELANKDIISRLPSVIQVMEIAGQFQVVIGNDVNDVYREIIKISSIDSDEKHAKNDDEKGNLFDQAIDIISGIFTPLLGALAGAGILKGLLIITTASGILIESDGTYQILYAASDSLFYFLPMLIAFTSAKKFGADPYVAVVIAGALLYPDLMDAYHHGQQMSFLGIPVILANYATSVIPIILAVYVISKIQPILNKWFPSTIKTFFTPLTLIAFMVPMTLLVFGPLGSSLSYWLAQGYSFIYDGSALIAGGLVGFFWQILVIFGLHWGIVPIAINNLSEFGSDTFTAMLTPAILSQAGAALGVWLRTKQRKIKTIAGPATVAGVFGVTEPAIYGITLRYKKPFIIGCISGAIGGSLAGISGASSKSLAVPGLTTLPVFFGEGFTLFLLAIFGSFILATILTYFIGFKDEVVQENQETTENSVTQSTEKESDSDDSIVSSPLTGPIIQLQEVNDAVFSSEAVGKGIAIVPVEGKLHAPVNGVVTSVFPSNHAVGITSNAGIQILIHIGLDTVQLEGQYFDMKVKEGDKIDQGQLLGEFDIEAITNAGFDIISPVIITNSEDYLDVISTEGENADIGGRLLTVVR